MAAVGFVIAVGTVYGPRVTAQIAINKMNAPARPQRAAPVAPAPPQAEIKVGAGGGGKVPAADAGAVDPFAYQ